MKTLFILKIFVLLNLLFCQNLFAYQTEILQENGDSANRVDMVVLGDGYTVSEQEQFYDDASNMIEYLFSQSPFKEYREFFNVHLVYLESNESGADHPSLGVFKDTALDATFEYNDIERLLVVDYEKALSAAFEVEVVDYVLVIVNDPMYGGSGGSVAISSTNEEASEILVHELGHMIADLADEYEDPYPGYPVGDYEDNVTFETQRNLIPWNVWILQHTPLPTPQKAIYQDQVGLFEGARYREGGIYRPKLDCKMRSLGARFCEVCTESLIGSFYDLVSPSDASPLPIELESGEVHILDAKPLATTNHSIKVKWFVNDLEIKSILGSKFQFDSLTVLPGETIVEARLSDQSEFIRRDEIFELAEAEISWVINVLASEADGDLDLEQELLELELSEADTEQEFSGLDSGCAFAGAMRADFAIFLMFLFALYFIRGRKKSA